MEASIDRDVARYFMEQLRGARAAVLRDAEAYHAVVVVLERLGRVLLGKRGNGLRGYAEALNELVESSPLGVRLPSRLPAHHIPFSRLLDLIAEARNAAVHEGAIARHLANHALEAALVLEDALMENAATVGDYMVRGAVVAHPWQPLSLVRQAMLANSFSFLPVRVAEVAGGRWQLISDVALARFFRAAKDRAEREDRMALTVRDAALQGCISFDETVLLAPDAPIDVALQRLASCPVLVTGESQEELLGILTAFDLL
jgi:CBS domain-containing protein